MRAVSFEVGDLAYQLWKVRDEALKGTRFEDAKGAIPNDDDVALYRELAAYVLENYAVKETAKPSAVPVRIRDKEGDTFYLGPNGFYSLEEDNPNASWTRDEIRDDFGIEEEFYV